MPLKNDQTPLREVGPAGYSSWQNTDDSGSGASNPGVHDEVHAVGGQLGLTYAPWNLSVSFHGFYEFFVGERFKSQSHRQQILNKKDTTPVKTERRNYTALAAIIAISLALPVGAQPGAGPIHAPGRDR